MSSSDEEEFDLSEAPWRFCIGALISICTMWVVLCWAKEWWFGLFLSGVALFVSIDIYRALDKIEKVNT